MKLALMLLLAVVQQSNIIEGPRTVYVYGSESKPMILVSGLDRSLMDLDCADPRVQRIEMTVAAKINGEKTTQVWRPCDQPAKIAVTVEKVVK